MKGSLGMVTAKSKKEVQSELDKYYHGNVFITTSEADFKGTASSDTWVKCLTCRYTWKTATRSIINRANKTLREGRTLGNGCIRCNKKRNGKRCRYTRDEIEKTIKACTNDISIVGELDYSGNHPVIPLKCKRCGHEWSPNIASYLYYLKKAHWRDCPNCNIKKKHKNLEYDLDIIKDIVKRDGVTNVEIIDYNQKTMFMTIKCLVCGNTYNKKYIPNRKQRIISLKCSNCNIKESSGEYVTRKFLEYNNIRYKKEYLFYNPVSTSNQRMDYFLPEYNRGIEIMGEQHYDSKNGFNSKRMNFLDWAKYRWARYNGIIIDYVDYHSSILHQLTKLFPGTKIPPRNYYNYDQTYDNVIQYLWEGHNLQEASKEFNIGIKPVKRFLKMAGYKDYYDLADQALQERNGFNYDDLINWLRHHHASTLKDKYGVTLRYVQRHIFEKDDYPYACTQDIKNETIKSSELPEYRKNHNRRETARYFMTDENTIDKVLGTKEW